MAVSVILGHPDPASFNHAIAKTAVGALVQNGHDVRFHDLYGEDFNPLLAGREIPKDATIDRGLAACCAETEAAEGIIIVHPNWWGQPPAILKGWLDRVLRPGIAYAFREGDKGDGIPVGLLKAKCALVFNTADTPAAREAAVFGDPLDTLWRTCVFDLCGVKRFHRRTFSPIVTSTPAERHRWLEEVRAVVGRFLPAKTGDD